MATSTLLFLLILNGQLEVGSFVNRYIISCYIPTPLTETVLCYFKYDIYALIFLLLLGLIFLTLTIIEIYKIVKKNRLNF